MPHTTVGKPGRDNALSLTCHRCGGALGPLSWQRFKNGSHHLRGECTGCGSVRYVPQTHPNLAVAPPIPATPEHETAPAPVNTPTNQLDELLRIVFDLHARLDGIEDGINAIVAALSNKEGGAAL